MKTSELSVYQQGKSVEIMLLTVRNILGIANGKQFSLLPASKKLG